jgi:flagellar biosynthesis/type III secretory pathway M-ring protein FliF/YscJ
LQDVLQVVQRNRIAAVALTVLTAAVVAIAFALHADRLVPLFAAPLAPDQIAEVGDVLAAWGIPYVPVADNIRIDGARRGETLLRLSVAGIPRAHLVTRGEALAKANALTPQAVLDAEVSEGLAAEIAASLRGVRGVREARVIVAPAKPAAFADEDAHAASAAVRLSLEPGVVLEPPVAAGIRRFVAASVPGLDASRVALLDDRASPIADSESPQPSDRQTALQSALDAAFGTGATIVRVREEYDPPAHIARLSVAVAVDRARRLDLVAVRSLTRAVAGVNDPRGDAVAVEEVDFAGHAGPPGAHPLAWLVAILPMIAAAAIGAVALRVLAAPLTTVAEAAAARLRIAGVERAVSGYAPAQVAGALRGEPPHTAAAIISALPAATATAVLDLYPPDVRAAIVGRLSRPRGDAIPDLDAVLRRA